MNTAIKFGTAKNKVNASNHVFTDEILEILEIERKATKKESEE